MAQISLEQALQIAREHHAAGRLAEAEAILRQVLAQSADHPVALHLLGLVAHDAGHREAAAELIRKSIAIEPRDPAAHLNLAFLLEEMGRVDEAIASYRAGLAIQSNVAEAQSNLSNLLNVRGRFDEAERAARAATALRPDLAATHNNLGNALRGLGRADEGSEAYRAALRVDSNFPDAQLNFGYVLMDLGRLPEAADAFRAAAGNPEADQIRALNSLGVVLASLHRHAEAEAVIREVIARDPNYAGHYNNLGNVLCDLGRFGEAVTTLRRAVELTPDDAQAWNNLGNALTATSALDDAVESYRRAIAIDPNFGEAYNNLGHVLKDTLRQHEAVTAYREAVRLRPQMTRLASNLLYGLHFLDDIDPREVFAEHVAYGKRLCSRESPSSARRLEDRLRLRVGFVSGDLREHPVGRFMLPVFRHNDRAAVEFVVFSQWAGEDDNVRELRANAAGWHDIIGLTDAAVAELVRAERIDVLVDLAGHTAHNRLGVFALKPAAVQLTYLGYPNTTGLPTIDYRITDALADPPGESDATNAERLIRLPETAWCFSEPANAPDVAPPPCVANGYVTFGSFNNLAKLSGATIELWSRVLHAVPDSRLLLKAASLRDATTRQRVPDAFAARGVARERVEPLGMVADAREHLALYGRIDIALDTFPYHGTTTTCEAMFMGVPVVTLAGRTHASRVGVSLLSNVDLNGLVTADAEGYVRAAAGLATADHDTLFATRAGLRERLRSSPLMAGAPFARAFEACLRQAWRGSM